MIPDSLRKLWFLLQEPVKSSAREYGSHVATFFVMWGVPALAWRVFKEPNGTWVLVGLTFLSAALILRLHQKVKRLSDALADASPSALEGDYAMRSRMWRREKAALTEHVVNSVIPMMVTEIQDHMSELERLIVLVDSGSTFAGVPAAIARAGVPTKPKVSVEVLTNSLSGIHNLLTRPTDEKRRDRLPEERFELLGGVPRREYLDLPGGNQAATLKAVFAEKKANPERVAILAIMTGNWLLTGIGLDCLQLCARGVGHLDFKRQVRTNADRVVLVAPLAKILRIDSVTVLNKAARLSFQPSDNGAWVIPATLPAKPLLVTTRRNRCPMSPLHGYFEAMADAANAGRPKNFVLDLNSPHFAPDGSKPHEIRQAEFAHPVSASSPRTFYGVAE